MINNKEIENSLLKFNRSTKNMREELIVLLEEAFEAGIITSKIHTQIDAIKKKMKLSETEYLQIEDEIRLNAYVRKVKDREKKGVTFLGDLRKQYKITEEDKIVIQEKFKSEQDQTAANKQTETPKKSDSVVPSNVSKQTELSEQQEPMIPDGAAKISESPKKQDQSKRQEPAKLPDSIKKQDMTKQTDIPNLERMPESKQPSKEPPVILVADDNDIQLFLMKKIIEGFGYTCITTDTPETAVRIISEKQPAVVFCDVNFGIGKPTGMDVFTNIRAKNILVPFILVSAFMQKEFKDHAKRIGVTEYLTKPTDPDQLLALLKKYVTQ